MREEWIRTPRTARFHLLGGGDHGPREIWFVLHGYRQLAGRFLRYFTDLDDGTRLVVAPEALSRFYVDPAEGRHGGEDRVGASWMTREDREHEIADYVEYLDRLADLLGSRAASDARRIVLGFSQGGHTAARWAVSGRSAPEELVLWGAYLPEDLHPPDAESRFAACRVTLVRGSEDVHRDPDRAEREADRLRAWGVEPRILEYAGGHRIDRATLEELARVVGADG